MLASCVIGVDNKSPKCMHQKYGGFNKSCSVEFLFDRRRCQDKICHNVKKTELVMDRLPEKRFLGTSYEPISPYYGTSETRISGT